MKSAALFSALCALAAGPGAAEPPRAQTPPAARLLVVLSVDQMRADYLDRFPLSGPGGFSRLLREGAYFTQARNIDVPTETSPGHATLLTGRPPSAHCVVAYDWWDPGTRRMVYSVEDPVFGRSPRNLLSATLGDALKARDPASLVVSISGKDRSGILLGGHRPDAALWYEPETGGFATSPYYGPLPSWAARWKAARPPGFTLSPAFDRLVLDAALEAVRSLSLGADEHPDLLAVGISGVDVVGHRHGPGHPSMDAQLEGLDEGLGRFLSELDARVGRGRYALVLASDHGVLPVPESPAGKALGARRILFEDWRGQAERALRERLSPSDDGTGGRRWIAGGFPPHIHLDREGAARSGLGRDDLLSKAAQALRELDSVAEVFTSAQLEGFETASSSYATVFRRAFCPGRSGDLMVLLKPFVFIADGPQGTGHGLPYDYDARVPLLFIGPGIAPGPRDLPASLEDIAPTAARLIEVPFPPAPGSRVLEEIFGPAAP